MISSLFIKYPAILNLDSKLTGYWAHLIVEAAGRIGMPPPISEFSLIYIIFLGIHHNFDKTNHKQEH